jgi:hypothetical protein
MRLKQPDDSLLIPAMQALTPTVDGGKRVSEATTTFEGDTHIALRKLKRAGLLEAIVVDLSRPGLPVNVVKAGTRAGRLHVPFPHLDVARKRSRKGGRLWSSLGP